MPTVYTIEGARRRKRRSSNSGGARRQRAKFRAAAKACKGRRKGAFKACMREKLRR